MVHVKNTQDCCLGTYIAKCFAASIPITYIWHCFPCYSFPTPYPTLSLPSTPQQTSVCGAPLPMSMCSHCSTPAYEWEHAVFDFLFLCQFAENDVLQIHPCPYKWHKLIISDCCLIFRGVYVPHFPNPVYHQWAFGLIPGLCYCEQCWEMHKSSNSSIPSPTSLLPDFWL